MNKKDQEGRGTEEIDPFVVAQSSEDSACDALIRVKRSEVAGLSIPVELAAHFA